MKRSHRKSWLSRWSKPVRSFSFFNPFETVFSTFTKFFSAIISDDDYDDEDSYQNNGASYKNHQLLRITPKTKTQVQRLLELKDNEPEDVKFWTLPAKNK